jgi:hypothetical protein
MEIFEDTSYETRWCKKVGLKFLHFLWLIHGDFLKLVFNFGSFCGLYTVIFEGTCSHSRGLYTEIFKYPSYETRWCKQKIVLNFDTFRGLYTVIFEDTCSEKRWFKFCL